MNTAFLTFVNAVLEPADHGSWSTRKDRISQAEIDVFTMLSEDWDISDIDMAEEVDEELEKELQQELEEEGVTDPEEDA